MSRKAAPVNTRGGYDSEDDPGSGYYVSEQSTPPEQEDATTETETDEIHNLKVIQVITAVPKPAPPPKVIRAVPKPAPPQKVKVDEDLSKVGLLIDIETDSDSEVEIKQSRNNDSLQMNDLPQKTVATVDKYTIYENAQVIVVIPPGEEKPNKPESRSVVTAPSANTTKIYDDKNATPPPRKIEKIPEKKTSPPKNDNFQTPPTSACSSTKPDIVIGEIDKDEATIIYENLLGVGKRVLDWLSSEMQCCPNFNVPTTIPQKCKRPETQAFQRQIVSIETEYNRLKQYVESDNPAKMDPCAPQPIYYSPEEEIKPEDIQPKVFSSNVKATENSNKLRLHKKVHITDDELPCSSTHKSKNPSVIHSCCCPCKSTTKNCSSCLGDRLKNLEAAFKNHEGNFTNVLAELRACLDYCDSNYSDDGDEELRHRITGLFKIVELHKAALEDWKKEFESRRKANK